MAGLKVVALISGGKDSLFSMLHCLHNGHEIVALANLHPRPGGLQDEVDDLDSYMYQTVGHGIIPLYEKVLGLPLYRQEIVGSAVDQSKSYAAPNERVSARVDETESLVPLLQKVQARHPEVNAVSTGAILSDYQRTRVESVAIRLGLTPLSYLWQWPLIPPHTPSSLLKDMAAVGQESRIIKVASGGLDESFLWLSLADPRIISRLERAVARFGAVDDGAVLGEGGEFETLALVGPPPLWKARVQVDEEQVEFLAGEAGSASVRIADARILPPEIDAPQNGLQLPTPPLLEPRFQPIMDRIKEHGYQEPNFANAVAGNDMSYTNHQEDLCDHVLIQKLMGDGFAVTEQAKSIMNQVSSRLQRMGASFAEIAYITIIMRDMSDFIAVNAIYGAYFREPNPPARVTIASSAVLPADKHIMLSATIVLRSSKEARHGLHVQSRSYWAPANIGPYSQAISVPLSSAQNVGNSALVYVAGQIPLVPASMEPVRGKDEGTMHNQFALETVLALQHLTRIGRTMHVRRWACAIAFVVKTSLGMEGQRAVARQAWQLLHDREKASTDEILDEDHEDDSFDIWDVRHGSAQQITNPGHALRYEDTSSDGPSPPLYVIEVDALPRGVGIEWVANGLTADGEPCPPVPHSQHLLGIFAENIV